MNLRGLTTDRMVDELTRDKMFTRPAPLPERKEELDYLERALKLKAPGLF